MRDVRLQCHPLVSGVPLVETTSKAAVLRGPRSFAIVDVARPAPGPHDVANAEDIVVLPSTLDEQPFPGEPLACALNVFRRCRIDPGQRVAIIGIGFMGAVLTALCKQAGAEVFAISRRTSSLDLACRMGARSMIRMDDHDRIIAEVSQATNGAMCDCTIECVGEQWPLDLGTALTGVRGRLVIAGYHQDLLRYD